MISIVIPSYNNLRHLKNAYASVKRHAPQVELIMIDDGSTDGTWDWMQEIAKQDKNSVVLRFGDERLGHTILYDAGIDRASHDVVGILHADMLVGPNYVENMLKHLKPGVVVAGTRVEPPLHPPGNEKIIQNFGIDFDDLNVPAFEEFCIKQQQIDKDRTTKGMFAPWIIRKEDFLAMGGHDHVFAPFPYEDSDIFERWLLSGYELVQSRDALVYHLTCRGHRFTEQIGKDDEYYKIVSKRAAREYLRKWGSWIKNDEFQHPIIKPKYDIGFAIKNCNLQVMDALEPWCSTLYSDDEMGVVKAAYYDYEQYETKTDLKKKIRCYKYEEPSNDIVLEFDAKQLTDQSYSVIQNLPFIIQQSGEIGTFQLDIFKVTIRSMKTYEKDMIKPTVKYKV